MKDQPTAPTWRYARALDYVRSTPWALMPQTMAVLLDVMKLRAHGHRLSRQEIDARLAASETGEARIGAARAGSIMILPLHGVVMHRADMFSEISGAASLEKISQRFDAAMADSAISTIVLSIDSPGGAVDGVPEFAEKVRAARGVKRVVAVADSLAASAAYWIGSAAEEFVASPSAEVGSIGVYAAHQDLSKALEMMGVSTTLISAGKFKVEGNPFEPLGEEAHAAIQSRVEGYYDMFVKDVAKGRGTTPSAVRGGFGEGRTVLAKDALAAGMIDRIEPIEATLARLQKSRGPRRNASARLAQRMAFAG